MKTGAVILTIGLFAAATTALAATNDLTEMLQQGLFEEEANRNLDAAISNYQSLIGQFDRNRQLAATAVFRLGECYRKLGRTHEAIAEYQRIVSEFPDEPSLLSLSESNLMALGAVPEMRSNGSGIDEAAALKVKLSGVDRLADQIRGDAVNYAKAILVLFPDDLLDKMVRQVPRLQEQVAAWRSLSNAPMNRFLTPVKEEGRDDLSEPTPNGIADFAWAQRQVQRQLVYIGRRTDHVLSAEKARLQVLEAVVAASPSAGKPSTQTAPDTDEEQQEISRLQAMIQNSPDLVNTPGNDGTPLFKAAYAGQLRVATFLLDHGADVNLAGGGRGKITQSWTPLFAATAEGHKAMVELLLDHGADVDSGRQDGATPLLEAVAHRYHAVAEVLMAHHANPNLESGGHDTPLMHAARLRESDTIKRLLAIGADVNHVAGNENTALHDALGAPDIMELLLENGADPNLPKTRLPLIQAAEMGLGETVAVLLKYHADPNLRDASGTSALHYAAAHKTILQLLLRNRADVNARNQSGDTPLHLAVCATNIEPAAVLLDNDADVNAADENGITPLHLAALKGYPAMIQLLLDHNANPNVLDKEARSPVDFAKGLSVSWTAMAPGILFPTIIRGSAPPPPAPGSSAPGYSAMRREALALLLQHGALEDRSNPNCISVRGSSGETYAIFAKDTNNWNHFTLLEVLLNSYRSSPPMQGFGFPDLTRVAVVHFDAGTGKQVRREIDLLNETNGIDCSKDVPLEFGDVVEIAEREHSLAARAEGLSHAQRDTLMDCLKGSVQVIVRKEKLTLPVYPVWGTAFLHKILGEARKILLSSSDLAHVKVTRRDPKTGRTRQWILDCSNPGEDSDPHLWLRNGDIIEVPDRK
jgi:ankyrin repeat protein